jgi:type II secretory pathway pseudopilin PulG
MKGEKGFALIGVLFAILILGLVAVIFAGGISTGAKAVFVGDQRATAESLAKSQLESTRNQSYIDYSDDPHETYDPISAPSGYSIELDAVPFDPDTGVPYNESGGAFDGDDGIQKITVTIDHLDDLEVITLEGYKVNR